MRENCDQNTLYGKIIFNKKQQKSLGLDEEWCTDSTDARGGPVCSYSCSFSVGSHSSFHERIKPR